MGGLASVLVLGRIPGGMLGVFLVGLAGALIGDWLFNHWLLVTVTSIVAAVLVIVALNSVMRRA